MRSTLIMASKPLAYWGVAALFRRLKKRTGIDGKRVSVHNCQRYMVTSQLADGRSPLDVQRQMGHRNLTVQHLKKPHEKLSLLRIDTSGSIETLGTGYWDEKKNTDMT